MGYPLGMQDGRDNNPWNNRQEPTDASYSNVTNKWYIIGTWKGKVKLLNEDMKTEIFSISKWKITPI